MLRRILTFSFAILLFALAFSIPESARPTAPPTIQREAPALRIIANLLLPKSVLAQATAVVADSPARGTPAAPRANHSHAILWGTLAIVAIAIAAAFFGFRRSDASVYTPGNGGSTGTSGSGRSSRPT